jgi:hypothetical protein
MLENRRHLADDIKSKMDAEEQFLTQFAEQIEGYIDPPTGITNIPTDENVSLPYPSPFG